MVPPKYEVPVWLFADGYQIFLYPDRKVLYNASGKQVDQVHSKGTLVYLGGGYILRADSGYTYILTDTTGKVYSREIDFLHNFYRVLQVNGKPIGVRGLPGELVPYSPNDNPYFTDLDNNYRKKDWGKTWFDYMSHEGSLVRIKDENSRVGYIAFARFMVDSPVASAVNIIASGTDTLMVVSSDRLYYSPQKAEKSYWTNYTAGLLNKKGQWIFGSTPDRRITSIHKTDGSLLVMQTESPNGEKKSWGYLDMQGNIVWWSDNHLPINGTVTWEKLKKWNPGVGLGTIRPS